MRKQQMKVHNSSRSLKRRLYGRNVMRTMKNRLIKILISLKLAIFEISSNGLIFQLSNLMKHHVYTAQFVQVHAPRTRTLPAMRFEFDMLYVRKKSFCYAVCDDRTVSKCSTYKILRYCFELQMLQTS